MSGALVKHCRQGVGGVLKDEKFAWCNNWAFIRKFHLRKEQGGVRYHWGTLKRRCLENKAVGWEHNLRSCTEENMRILLCNFDNNKMSNENNIL